LVLHEHIEIEAATGRSVSTSAERVGDIADLERIAHRL